MSRRTSSPEVAAQILLVEDSPVQAEQLRHLLEQYCYRVVLAGDGTQALAFMDEHKPALIISDIIMPEMTGYELCQHIKAEGTTQDIPVILLTALSSPQDVVEGLACGADGFLTKPYSADYLLGYVERTLANTALCASERAAIEVAIPLGDTSHLITADPQQMLNLLLSTYEAAVHKNAELGKAQDELHSLNEHLQDLVEERTAALTAEIAERERLQNELKALSLQDELTGLYNRRGFMTLAEQHWRLALRTHQAFSLLYMDVDGLKHINDTFGHAQGDQALRNVARLLERTFRQSDILARLGGDEFTVLLAECDLTSCQHAIARLKEALNQANAAASSLCNLSLSIGAACFNADRQVSLTDMLKQADAEMYAHKQRSHRGHDDE
jgi:two-component system cell cycle response regulator